MRTLDACAVRSIARIVGVFVHRHPCTRACCCSCVWLSRTRGCSLRAWFAFLRSGRMGDERTTGSIHHQPRIRYAAGQSSLVVLNISDPTSTIQLVGNKTVESLDARSIVLSTSGKFAFVSSGDSDSLLTFDVKSDPQAPSVTGGIVEDDDNLNGARGIAISPTGDYLFVASASGHMVSVVDVSRPSSPYVIGSITGGLSSFRAPHGIAVSADGSFVFVTGSTTRSLVALRVGTHTWCTSDVEFGSDTVDRWLY